MCTNTHPYSRRSAMDNTQFRELKDLITQMHAEVIQLKNLLVKKEVINKATPDDYGNAMGDFSIEEKTRNDALSKKI
jgi:hypothetical protein